MTPYYEIVQGCPDCAQLTGGRCPRHAVTFTYYGQGQTPHSCPVCGGRGTVRAGFYDTLGLHGWMGSSIPEPELCRSCGGTGVLWR